MTIQRHLDELYQNRVSWQKKPVLRKVYRRFYTQIASVLADFGDAPNVELGSGIGKISEVIPNCIKTDIAPNPWIDQVENAYQLSFRDQSISNIILLDVFHHLKYVTTAMEEFHRVLIPGGRVVILEPCVSALGLIVYGLAHKEPLGLTRKIHWAANSRSEAIRQEYYAAQGNAFRVFFRGAYLSKLAGWQMIHCERMTDLSYLSTGGYSGPELSSLKSIKMWDMLGRLLCPFPMLFATRLLIGIEKTMPGYQSKTTTPGINRAE